MNGIGNVVRYGGAQNLKETDEYAFKLPLLEVVDVFETGEALIATGLTWK